LKSTLSCPQYSVPDNTGQLATIAYQIRESHEIPRKFKLTADLSQPSLPTLVLIKSAYATSY